jgi:hypothetical protein
LKLFLVVVATLILAGIPNVASTANQYAEASIKLEEIISSSLGLATFSPSVIMTDGQTHITLDSTQLGDYPTPADVKRIIELYYKIVAGTGYAGSLVLVINNLDGIATYRWLISPYAQDDFNANQNYVMENMQRLNPGLEGIAGSGSWIYSDPNYVGRRPAGEWDGNP